MHVPTRVHKIIRYTQNYQIYTKLSDIHKVIRYTQNYQIYTKLSDIHKIIRYTQNYQIYTKLSDIHKIIRYTQNYQIYTKMPAQYTNVVMACARHCVIDTNVCDSPNLVIRLEVCLLGNTVKMKRHTSIKPVCLQSSNQFAFFCIPVELQLQSPA